MESLQVLLVDDEYLAIEDLKSMVDWEALGYRIAGAAHNGKQALGIAAREKPVSYTHLDVYKRQVYAGCRHPSLSWPAVRSDPSPCMSGSRIPSPSFGSDSQDPDTSA